MDRKLFGLFSGWHLTILALGAMLIPGAVVAAVAYQPVAIVNPSTGSTSFVDGARRLYVLDPLAAYANDPARIVNIQATVGQVSNEVIYTVPANSTLILKSIQTSHFGNAAGSTNFIYLIGNGSNILSVFESTLAAASDSYGFGSGVIARSGALTVITGGSSGFSRFVNLQGYLVPSSALPAPSSAGAAAQIVSSDNPRAKISQR